MNIIQRHPDITPSNVVGHSDISLGRKNDPGAAFPWGELYKSEVGAWYDQKTKDEYVLQFSQKTPENSEIISKFKEYGYNVTSANSNQGLNNLVRAFQLHFRPKKYNGNIDIETAAILYALVDKYSTK